MEKKKGESASDNSAGTVSVVMGILSLTFALLSPIMGIIFGIVGFFFSSSQLKNDFKGWGKIGKNLAIIGIVVSILLWILTITLIAPYIEQYMASYTQAG